MTAEPPGSAGLTAWLRERDPRLAPILDADLPDAWSLRPDLYEALLHAIVAQQLSVKAADTIHARFLALLPGRETDPEALLELTPGTLRAAGISRQKAGYLQAAARFTRDGHLDAARLQALDDEALIAHLAQIKGVGRWTAQMLLIFSLNRPDVLPVDDLGIQNAMKALYRLRVKDKALLRRMEQLARPWRPHRSTVCRYLWRWGAAQA